ncbi:MAG: Gldg family protein [Bacteroidota bacterium]
MKKNTITILLLLGIAFMVNMAANKLFFRWDLTADGRYSLSDATVKVLKDLQEPVNITAYYSEDLELQLQQGKEALQDLLYEYQTKSDLVAYKFVTPDTEALEQEAQQNGVFPVQAQSQKKNEISVQKIYGGLVIQIADRKDVIPFVQPNSSLEYTISSKIKQLSIVDKPNVAILRGHGEPSYEDMQAAAQMLGVLYNVDALDLNEEAEILPKFRSAVLLGTKDSIPQRHLDMIDAYLAQGGNLLVGIDRVNGDLQQATASENNTGLETWLAEKGIVVEPSILTDVDCGSVTVQQNLGGFTIPSQIQFPYFPMISNFSDHPTVKGLEAAVLIFPSPIRFMGDSSFTFTPLAYTSSKTGSQAPPFRFDIQKRWTEADFPLGEQVVVALAEGPFEGSADSKILVISDGEFGAAAFADNNNLFVNCIDWLSDETGLVDLRTKGATSRPIKTMEAGVINTYKYLNFFLPILLVGLYGFFRASARRRTRLKRSQESYE